ncbi:HDOD domain-containing protein [Methylophaga sp.]|uniref:HDOD domain-containing protein n=1 Tax=Methylophaga sp. TaxID=2024840 RepID=UPI003F6986A2
MAAKHSKNVNEWVKQLSDDDMPVFSGTVSSVTDAVNSERTSASDVARIVLKDASLTTRLLKVSNSFHFNPTKQQINTVSRAVMVIGFDQVRALTLSMVLVDNLGKGQNRQKLVEEMGMAFHAATQAQELAVKVKAKNPEDIFVATLLSRLGQMAFWAFADESADALQAALDSGVTETDAESEILGFPLISLTRGLSKSWSLGELLDDYVNGRSTDTRTTFINYGNALAGAAAQGWDSDETETVIREMAETLNIKTADLKDMAFANARKAKEVTKLYGSYEASREIPQPYLPLIDDDDIEHDESELVAGDRAAEPEQESTEPAPIFPEADNDYLMSVMEEIATTVQDKASLGIVLEMVLEGVYRGVGTDRAMFAILNPERTHLSCKYVLGDAEDTLTTALKIDIRKQENVFHQIISTKKARLISGDPKNLGGTLSRDTLSLLGTPPYIVMPAIVRNKVIGVFMADRNASGRDISQQDFLAFQQFCQQANMGLTFLAMQG